MGKLKSGPEYLVMLVCQLTRPPVRMDFVHQYHPHVYLAACVALSTMCAPLRGHDMILLILRTA